MKNKKEILITAIIAFILFVPHILGNIINKLPTSCLDGWLVAGEKYNNTVFNLPTVFNDVSNIQIRHQLPQINNGDMLFFYTSDQGVCIFIDDLHIYKYGMDDDSQPFMKTPGSLWHKIPLQKEYSGKTISLFFSYPYEHHQGKIFKIYISQYIPFLNFILFKYIFSLESTVLVFILSILYITLYLLVKTDDNKIIEMVYLALYVFIACTWFLCDNKIAQFLTNTPKLLSMLSLMALILIYLPPTIYLARVKKLKAHIFFVLIFTIYFTTCITIFMLELFSVIDFYSLRNYIHAGIYVLAVIYYVTFIISYIYDKRFEIRGPIQNSLFVVAFSSIDLVVYSIDEENYSASYTSFALLIFVIYCTVKFFLELREVIIKNRIYCNDVKLYDFITGTKNQTSFNYSIQKLKSLEKISIIIFNIDELSIDDIEIKFEKTNEALSKIAGLIKSNFLQYGECYRSDKNEFSVIIDDRSNIDFHETIQDFRIILDTANREFNYELNVCMGFVDFDPELDDKFEDTLLRSRERMLKYKMSQKLVLENNL